MSPVPLEFLVPLGGLAAFERPLTFVILVVVLANLATRFVAYRTHLQQAEAGDGDEALARYLPHEATNLLLLVLSFLFMIVEPHGGMVLSVLVVGAVLSDFFEFEARRVEARNDMELERPKSALVASVLVVLYAGFQSLFFLVEPLWNAIV